MEYIYFVKSKNTNSKIYIGQQDRDTDGSKYARLEEHARKAYGLQAGGLSGAAQLMQQYSLSGIQTYIIYNPQNIAALEKIRQEFHQTWEYSGDGDDVIDFAEMAIIQWYYRNDSKNLLNKIVGGKSTTHWTWNTTVFQQNFMNQFKQELLKKGYKITNAVFKSQLEIGFQFQTFENFEAKIINPSGYQLLRLISDVVEWAMQHAAPTLIESVITTENIFEAIKTSLRDSPAQATAELSAKLTAELKKRFNSITQSVIDTLNAIGEKSLAQIVTNNSITLETESAVKQIAKITTSLRDRILTAATRDFVVYKRTLQRQLTQDKYTFKIKFPRKMWESDLSVHKNQKIFPQWYKDLIALPEPITWAIDETNNPELMQVYQEISYQLFDKVMQDVKTPLQDLYSKGFALEGAQGEDNIHFTFIQDGIIYFRPNATLNDHTTRAITPSLYEKMHEVYLTLPAAEWIIKNHHWEAFYRPMVARWRHRHNGEDFTLLDRRTGQDNANYYIYSVAPFTNQIYVAYKGMLITNDDTLTYY